MAPWEIIEAGFQLGVHVVFATMGFAAAVALVVGAVWAIWAITERLKP